ncbi:MAG: ribbon-helix-helix protein, CopG family [Desulfuromonadaceae bacterium]
MAKYKDTPRYNVISMRVSDFERQEFETIASFHSLNISQMMREAMGQFTAKTEAVSAWTERLRGD